jgi:putative ribosome biogenesis GTPase RsgA
MNLVEGLLKADAAKAKEYAKGTFKSRRLATVMGENKPVDVEIREIDMETIKNIQQYSMRKDGSIDRSKTLDANLMLVVQGVTNPDLTNSELQKHFGACDAMDLANILFRFEATFLADEIVKLSNMQRADDEDTIKN